MEIAFISANKLRIELRSKQGVFGGKWVAKYIKEPNEFISTVLVATNLALVIYGIAMGDILQYYLSFIVTNALAKFILTTVLSTVIVLITAEYIPKTIFRLQADTLLFVFVVPFRVAHLILWPLISFTKGASTTLLSLFTQTDNTTQSKVFSKVDLDEFISSIESSKDLDSQELDTEAFRNALEFSEIDVREIMVPRKELVGLEINTSIDELTQAFIETSLSRILIYRENIDNIIGFVHHSDLFHQPEKLNEILHPVIITSENTEAQQLLRRFIFERKSLAVVVDEFGGTAGIATVEDLVEEIFGEIKDEFDTEDAFELQLGDNHYRFAARLEIDYLNEKYGFDFKEGDYTTLGGYIIFYAERIPELNETLRFENLEFHITKIDGARIEEVELKRF
jgi:CBS domain containing-hemolysin-like protein